MNEFTLRIIVILFFASLFLTRSKFRPIYMGLHLILVIVFELAIGTFCESCSRNKGVGTTDGFMKGMETFYEIYGFCLIPLTFIIGIYYIYQRKVRHG